MITAKIIADSVNLECSRLTSWILTYPRFIHAEFMTHRCFSRNAASSRAIPISKMMESVDKNPVVPEFWGCNKKGMQAGEQLEGVALHDAKTAWMAYRLAAIDCAEELETAGVHKQISNRVSEPWSHITVLATASNHSNFFSLRAHPDAQPEFQVLAYRMLDAYQKSEPKKLQNCEWHMVFDTFTETYQATRLKVATARAARVSYLTFDGEHSVEKDCELHDRLAASGHWSPFEHCAEARDSAEACCWGNFGPGWNQYRKNFFKENKDKANLDEIMSKKPDWVTL